MVQLNDREHIDKNRLLFDPVTLEHKVQQYNSPLGIKLNVKTRATQYEIRTAMRYWLGQREPIGGEGFHNTNTGESYRTSKRIWGMCEAFDDGDWVLTEHDEIEYAEQ